MLVTREAPERGAQHQSSSFAIGETVHVRHLGRTGRISGMEGGRWLVRLTEGDAPVSCAASDLEKRQTLMG